MNVPGSRSQATVGGVGHGAVGHKKTGHGIVAWTMVGLRNWGLPLGRHEAIWLFHFNLKISIVEVVISCCMLSGGKKKRSDNP